MLVKNMQLYVSNRVLIGSMMFEVNFIILFYVIKVANLALEFASFKHKCNC